METTSVSCPSFTSSAIMPSTGNSTRTPFALARSSNSFANSILSASNNDVPISFPVALRKVYAIPPPIRMVSTLFSKFSITPILSDTFAPPRMATKGRFGSLSALPIISTSFCTKSPRAEGSSEATPTLELCARWQVANASFTKTSAKEANSEANAGSFLDSPAT